MIAALDATPLTVATGGITRYTHELARALAEDNPGDHFWLLSDQPFCLPAPAPPNLHQGSGPRTAAERRWWLWGLDREMMRRRVEVFHGTDFSVPYIPRRPSVMTFHDLSPWLPGWQPHSIRLRHRVPVLLRAHIPTMMITHSEAVRRAAIARFRLDGERVVAVPLAASSHFRPIDSPPPARPYFLFVGTLEPRKNIHGLIEAWREVRKTADIDLVLAGRVREDFQAPAPEPGLHLPGAVPEQELPALYSAACAVVYPSLYEGFGLPVLEAMQCGATVIASRDPAIMEVSAGAAIHVEATDVGALVDAMRARPVRREESLKRAAQFSWSITARKTREVYDAARRIFSK